MIGVSVYLGQQSKEEQEAYLTEMKAAGFRGIFTSLHIPEDDQSLYGGYLRVLGEQAERLGMELMIDISPASLSKLGFTYESAAGLKEWGVTGLRVDYGIEPDRIVSLSQQMKVALNASTLNEDEIRQLLALGLARENTEAWHNYYPRPETALSYAYFEKKNILFKKYGISAMAFIPGDGKLRGPLRETLPTLEEHRYGNPFAVFLDMKRHCEKVFIGDCSLSEMTLRQFSQYAAGSIPLRCELADSENLLVHILKKHKSRMDPSSYVLRSETSRLYADPGEKIEPSNTIERPKGTITLDNWKYGRYSGELQITLTDLTADERVNVVGKVHAEDLVLLEYIEPGSWYHFDVCSK